MRELARVYRLLGIVGGVGNLGIALLAALAFSSYRAEVEGLTLLCLAVAAILFACRSAIAVPWWVTLLFVAASAGSFICFLWERQLPFGAFQALAWLTICSSGVAVDAGRALQTRKLPGGGAEVSP